MAQVDVLALRQLTHQAILDRAAEERRRIIAQEEREAEERREERHKADVIIGQIAGRCRTEAMACRSHAIIMNTTYQRPYTEDVGKIDWNRCQPAWLTGASRIVWDACVEAKLAPTLEFWHDGYGESSGFNIVVHW